MITKNDLVLATYEELRISGLTSKPSAEEIKQGVKRLDMMLLSWQNLGLCLSYVRSVGFNNIDPNQDSGLNDINAQAVVLNLAKSLAPGFGKALHPDTRVEARKAYLGLFSSDMTYREPDPYQPVGTGCVYGYGYGGGYGDNLRFQVGDKKAPDNCDTLDIKVGEVDFYPIDFSSYINEVDGDSIASFVVDDGQGVKVLNSAQDGNVIILEAKGLIKGFAPIKITVTCSPSGRVNPETINFNVTTT